MHTPPQWSLSLRLPHEVPIHTLSSPIRATFPTHLILPDFITSTILDEEYKSFRFSLCNLLHSLVTSSLLGPNNLLNTMFSNTIRFLSSRNISDQAFDSTWLILSNTDIYIYNCFHNILDQSNRNFLIGLSCVLILEFGRHVYVTARSFNPSNKFTVSHDARY